MRHPVSSWSSKAIGEFKSWRKNNPFGHKGFDYYVPRGTAVHSPGPGTVIAIGNNMDRNIGFGHNVTIRHDNGWTSICAHLDAAPAVRKNQRVTEGQYLGPAGDSGNAWAVGVHVHHQLWVSTALIDANLRDPLTYYGTALAGAGSTPIEEDDMPTADEIADAVERRMRGAQWRNGEAGGATDTLENILAKTRASVVAQELDQDGYARRIENTEKLVAALPREVAVELTERTILVDGNGQPNQFRAVLEQAAQGALRAAAAGGAPAIIVDREALSAALASEVRETLREVIGSDLPEEVAQKTADELARRLAGA